MKPVLLWMLLILATIPATVPAAAQEPAGGGPAAAEPAANPAADSPFAPAVDPPTGATPPITTAPAAPISASLLLVKADWSQIPAAKEIEAELRKALEDVPVPQALLERLPASGPQILFPPEVVSFYSAEHYGELLAWLQAKGLLEQTMDFPPPAQYDGQPSPRALATTLLKPYDLLALPPLPQQPVAPFMTRESQFLWSASNPGSGQPFEIRRQLAITERFRGAGGTFHPLDESSFKFQEPGKQVAVVHAFPGPDETRFRDAARQKGYEVLLTIQGTKNSQDSSQAKLHLPNVVSPIVVQRGPIHHWPEEEAAAPANPLSGGEQPAATDQAPAETVVFRIKSADPLAIEPTLRQLFEGELKIIAQHRGTLGSELIVRGPPKSIQQLADLLKLIDRPGGESGGDLYADSGYGVPSRASTEAQRKQYDALELQAAALAGQLRGQQALLPDGLQLPLGLRKSRSELRKVVAQAFAARQRLHEAELAALAERLKSTHQTLAMRERIKDAIIDRRVDDLLNPDVRWEASKAVAADRKETSAFAPSPPIDSAARAYRDTLRQRWELLKQAHAQGTVGQDEVLRAASEFYAAEAAAATNPDERRAALQKRIEQLEGVKSFVEQRYSAGQMTQTDLLAAQAALLKARADLAAEPGSDDSSGAAAAPKQPNVQVFLQGPVGATVAWNADVQRLPEGRTHAATVAHALVGTISRRLPARFTAPSGGSAWLSLSDIPGYAGLTLYGALTIAEVDPRTKPFLEHNAIPLVISAEDVDQAAVGNLVTKVVYLSDSDSPLGTGKVDTLVSTRLDPGVDPLAEAKRRVHVLAALRLLSHKPADESAAPAPASRGAASPAAAILPATGDSGLILRSADELQRRLDEPRRLVAHWRKELAEREAEVKAGNAEPRAVENAKQDLQSWQRNYDLAEAEYKAQIRLLELELGDATSAKEAAAQNLNRLRGAGSAVPESKLAEVGRALDAARFRSERAKTLLELYRKVDPGDSTQPPTSAQPTVTPSTNGASELRNR